MDRQQIERCLEQVAAYRASGQTAQVWGQANDIPLQAIRGWCAQSQRWQDRLDGVVKPASVPARPAGFVMARVGVGPVAAASSVRVNVSTGTAQLELHWPLTHTRELAAWVHELGR